MRFLRGLLFVPIFIIGLTFLGCSIEHPTNSQTNLMSTNGNGFELVDKTLTGPGFSLLVPESTQINSTTNNPPSAVVAFDGYQLEIVTGLTGPVSPYQIAQTFEKSLKNTTFTATKPTQKIFNTGFVVYTSQLYVLDTEKYRTSVIVNPTVEMLFVLSTNPNTHEHFLNQLQTELVFNEQTNP